MSKVLRPCTHDHDGDGELTAEDVRLHAEAYEAAILASDVHGAVGELEERSIEDDGFNVERCDVDFEFKIPDAWRKGTFTEEKTNIDKYRGPRWLYVDVRKEASLRHDGTVDVPVGVLEGNVFYTESDLCIPIDPDFQRVRIDATINPMLASILYMIGDQIQTDFTGDRLWIVDKETPEGYYDTYQIQDKDLVVRDIYDQNDIRYDFETKGFSLAVFTHFGDQEEDEPTWDDIRKQRNILLKDSDGSISEDMPQFMKDDVLVYRQLLRDIPDALSAFHPGEVSGMIPIEPNTTLSADAPVNPDVGRHAPHVEDEDVYKNRNK